MNIVIKNAYLNYQGLQLFENLNLVLPAGQWTCLLGPSGVGKTSLLRLIAGLATDANVKNPIETSDKLPLTGRLAYMAQQDLLMPWYSVLDNVLLGLRLRGEDPRGPANKKQAEKLLKRVGLENITQKKVIELSGGMRQRVALARTLMENKPVILMDEPFGAVDAITRKRLQDLAVELLQNRTVLLVTHDPLEALRLGNQVLVMTGLPAKLGAPFIPPGNPPRDLTDPVLLKMEVELLKQLGAAQEAIQE